MATDEEYYYSTLRKKKRTPHLPESQEFECTYPRRNTSLSASRLLSLSFGLTLSQALIRTECNNVKSGTYRHGFEGRRGSLASFQYRRDQISLSDGEQQKRGDRSQQQRRPPTPSQLHSAIRQSSKGRRWRRNEKDRTGRASPKPNHDCNDLAIGRTPQMHTHTREEDSM